MNRCITKFGDDIGNSGEQVFINLGGTIGNSGEQIFTKLGGDIENTGDKVFTKLGGDSGNSGKQVFTKLGGDIGNSGEPDFTKLGDDSGKPSEHQLGAQSGEQRSLTSGCKIVPSGEINFKTGEQLFLKRDGEIGNSSRSVNRSFGKNCSVENCDSAGKMQQSLSNGGVGRRKGRHRVGLSWSRSQELQPKSILYQGSSASFTDSSNARSPLAMRRNSEDRCRFSIR